MDTVTSAVGAGGVQLLPCPFCGSKRVVLEKGISGLFFVRCRGNLGELVVSQCSASGPPRLQWYSAIAGWNARKCSGQCDCKDDAIQDALELDCEAHSDHIDLLEMTIDHRNAQVKAMALAAASLARAVCVCVAEIVGEEPARSSASPVDSASADDDADDPEDDEEDEDSDE